MATQPINLVNTCGAESIRQADRDPVRQALMDVNDAAMTEIERLRGQRDRLRSAVRNLDQAIMAQVSTSINLIENGNTDQEIEDSCGFQPGDMTSD